MVKANLVHLGFEEQCIYVPIEKMKPSKPLLSKIKQGTKFKQILSSIETIGLVEPVVVTPNPQQAGEFLILDGHLRVEALQDLSHKEVWCLVSKDDEGFTYNRNVNRIIPIQEYRMIVQTHESGVSAATLAAALGISEDTIRQRFRLVEGICTEAVNLLADKPVPRKVFPMLKKMKAFRQIDVANVMINLNNYSLKFVAAMLHSTPEDQLVPQKKKKAVLSTSATESLQRLERELGTLQAQTKILEENYGPDNLQITIIKAHIKNLLDNARVVKWLLKYNKDYFDQLQLIVEMA